MTRELDAMKKIAIVDGIVSQDFPCRKCAYNLRGLPSNGTCPECNAPVEISISGDLLRYSDPNYLESLRRGILDPVGSLRRRHGLQPLDLCLQGLNLGHKLQNQLMVRVGGVGRLRAHNRRDSESQNK